MLMSTPGAGHNQPPGRWIAIDVGMLEHPVVGWKQPMTPANPKKKAASRCEAWIDLIRFARWKAGAIDNQGRVVYVERGELMASRSFLAQRWNWTEKAVRHFMKRLEQEFMVTKTEPRLVAGSEACPKRGQQSGQVSGQSRGQQKGQRSRNLNQHYRIENYDIYQVAREVEGIIRGQRKDTASDQPNDQHRGQRGASEGPESIQGDTKGYNNSPNGELSLSSDASPSKDPVSQTVREAHRLYNETAKTLGLPTARVLNKSRKRALALRIKEAGGLDGFRDALANLGKSSFLQGQNDRGWRADLEFVCQAKSFAKLMDGAYTDRNQTSNSTRRVLDELKAKKRQEINHG